MTRLGFATDDSMSVVTIDGVDYITTARAAEISNVGVQTILNRVRAGRLGAVRKVGASLLIPLDAVESYQKGSLRDLPDDLRIARSREVNRRNAKAQGRALRELAKRYRDEYLELFRKYRAELMSASPLPGEEVGDDEHPVEVY